MGIRRSEGDRRALPAARGERSTIDLAPVADGHDQHHEPVILDCRYNPVIADAVAPKSFAVASQGVAETARIVTAGDALAQIAQHTPLTVQAELAQVADGGAIELDPPDRRRHQRMSRKSGI